jgi:hypothetical protein
VGSGTAVEVERFVAAVALAGAILRCFGGQPEVSTAVALASRPLSSHSGPGCRAWPHPGTRANRTDGTLDRL